MCTLIIIPIDHFQDVSRDSITAIMDGVYLGRGYAKEKTIAEITATKNHRFVQAIEPAQKMNSDAGVETAFRSIGAVMVKETAPTQVMKALQFVTKESA